MAAVKERERIDDLLWRNFRIIQNSDWFCFGLDAVLLADFAELKPKEQVLDLCTGNGVIPLLLAAKEETAVLTGIELFPEVADMAGRSVRLNGLERRVNIITGDVCQISNLVVAHSFSVVTVNPPYRKKEAGRLSPSPFLAAAKAEVYCDLSQVVAAIAHSLLQWGRFYLVYPYDRLAELLGELQGRQLQVTKLMAVKNFSQDNPFLSLIGGVYGEGADNRLEAIAEPKEFTVFREDRTYTAEMEEIFAKYGKEKKK